MKGIKLSGLGKAVPKRSITNEELCQRVDSSDEWITTRTGIRARHIAQEEKMTQLASLAAQEALKNSGANPEDIDLVIVATTSPDYTMPSTACSVADELGINKATCFDLTAACSGFVYATQVAYSMLMTGMGHKALIIGAEVLSKVLNWEDRNTCVLFGDGAGAAVYEVCEENRLLAIETGTKPDGSKNITLPTIAYNHTFSQNEQEEGYIKMQGKEVYCFATTKVPESIRRVVEAVNMQPEDIDWFVLHQANARIMDSVAKRLHIDEKKFFKNVDRYGNTSAASIPIALYELSPQLKQGDKLILSGFGAGLTWGTMLLVWDK